MRASTLEEHEQDCDSTCANIIIGAKYFVNHNATEPSRSAFCTVAFDNRSGNEDIFTYGYEHASQPKQGTVYFAITTNSLCFSALTFCTVVAFGRCRRGALAVSLSSPT